ncbi:hypothetical protein QCA50_010392 [Cerrena zonata]|uniref:F-box domain-containing protein n=1 Tax=Cerrena zonata TaxID=2478898 RepID=A0AAW0FXS7_9APHY
MHSALLIDEILENVLHHVHEFQEYRWTLVQIARSCQAWRDPALDKIWSHLVDIKPVLNTLESSEARSYAARVKHITLRNAIHDHTQQHLILPELRSATLEGGGCNTAIDWAGSPALRRLKIDMQTIRAKPEAQFELGKRVAEILRTIQTRSDDGLQELDLKGHITSSLSYTIGSLTTLRSLTLLCGSTVTPRLLIEIATFPHLRDLRIQATHIDADCFRILQTNPGSTLTTFPSLHNLRLQSDQPLMQAVIELLQPSTLEHLHLEAYGPALDVTAWTPIMDTLASKASYSLRTLILEHYHTGHIVDHGYSLNSFTLLPLKSLAACRALQRFTLGTTSLINFTDRNIEEMSSWWPHLETLDLGTLPVLDEDIPYKPTLTVKSLLHLARNCTKLKDLVLSLDISAVPESDRQGPHARHALKSLRVGHVSDTKDVSDFIQTILSVFPSVETIECETHDGETSVVEPGRPKESDAPRVGTEDGFANGP